MGGFMGKEIKRTKGMDIAKRTKELKMSDDMKEHIRLTNIRNQDQLAFDVTDTVSNPMQAGQSLLYGAKMGASEGADVVMHNLADGLEDVGLINNDKRNQMMSLPKKHLYEGLYRPSDVAEARQAAERFPTISKIGNVGSGYVGAAGFLSVGDKLSALRSAGGAAFVDAHEDAPVSLTRKVNMELVQYYRQLFGK